MKKPRKGLSKAAICDDPPFADAFSILGATQLTLFHQVLEAGAGAEGTCPSPQKSFKGEGAPQLPLARGQLCKS